MMNDKSNSSPMSLMFSSHTIQYLELILEQFFDYHIAYQWDKAKGYIEHERDQFRVKNSHSILTSMLHCLAQVIVADRNYLTLQFFSSKVFQRKDLLKSTYENLKIEFQRLEERSNQLFLKHNLHSLPFQSSPIHNNNNNNNNNNSNNNNNNNNVQDASISIGSITRICDERADNEPAKDALDEMKSIPEQIYELSNITTRQLSSSLPKDSLETNLGSTKNNQSFFSKFFRKFSSNPTPILNTNNNSKFQEIASLNIVESLSDDQGHLSELSANSLDSLDQFAGHICGQLVNYCKVRIEMIDFYERLTNIGQVTMGKFCIIDDCLQTLTDIHNRADDSFHHPVLTRIKIMFMFECDILLALLRAHQSIQQWKYLESLFSLQEAHNKINRLANPKDFFFGNILLAPMVASISGNSINNQQQKPSPTSPGGSTSITRRNVTASSSLSSSSSSNLSVTNNVKDSGNNYSPLSPNVNFVYPVKEVHYSVGAGRMGPVSTSSSATKHLFQRVQPTMNDSKSIPLLIQWFNKYKLFLLSKYTFYFHSLLMIHLTPVQLSSSTISQSYASMTSSNSLSSLISQNSSNASNYAQTENFMRNICAKHFLFDFHTKIVQFVKKLDSSYMVLILDTHGKVISFSGYKSPFVPKNIPQGRSSLPIIYSYPGEFNMNRHPSLIMIMENRMRELNHSDAVVVEHDKLTNGHLDMSNISSTVTLNVPCSTMNGSNYNNTMMPNASYYLVRPDPDYTLALVCESKRLERDTHIISFMQEMCFSLKDSKILASLRTGNFKS